MWVFSTFTLVPSRPRFSTLPTMPTAEITRSTVISWLLPPGVDGRRDVVGALLQPSTVAPVRIFMPCFSKACAGEGGDLLVLDRQDAVEHLDTPSPPRPWCDRSSRTRCRSRPSRSPAATSASPAAPSLRGRSRSACRRPPGPGSCRARAPVARITFLAASVTLLLSFIATASLPAPGELRRAVEHRDLVLLHQALDAVAELAWRPCASARRSSLGSKRHVLDREAIGVGVLDQAVDLGGAQQRLGRDAAPVEADAAQCSRSTTAVFMPSCAARIAAT